MFSGFIKEAINQHNQQTKNAWWQFFTFDNAGNSTLEYNENNITQRDYKWDFEGRLVEMGNGSGTYKVEFRYDGFGRGASCRRRPTAAR